MKHIKDIGLKVEEIAVGSEAMEYLMTTLDKGRRKLLKRVGEEYLEAIRGQRRNDTYKSLMNT